MLPAFSPCFLRQAPVSDDVVVTCWLGSLVDEALSFVSLNVSLKAPLAVGDSIFESSLMSRRVTPLQGPRLTSG